MITMIEFWSNKANNNRWIMNVLKRKIFQWVLNVEWAFWVYLNKHFSRGNSLSWRAMNWYDIKKIFLNEHREVIWLIMTDYSIYILDVLMVIFKYEMRFSMLSFSYFACKSIFCLFMFLYNSWKHPLILEQKDKESYEMNDRIISAKNKCSTVYCTLKNMNDTVTFW